MTIDRRSLLKYAGLAPRMGAVPRLARASDEITSVKVDYTLRIAVGLVELASGTSYRPRSITASFRDRYCASRKGSGSSSMYTPTDTRELVHWRGQMIPSDGDGAAEEGSPYVPAHGMRRIAFMPKPSGFRFYHTHVAAGDDLNRGTYTGQAGPVCIEPRDNPGAYDREVFLVMKEFEPSFSRGGDMAMDFFARARLAAQHRLEPLFHQLFAHPVDHGCAGCQSINDLVVAPSFAGFREPRASRDRPPLTILNPARGQHG